MRRVATVSTVCETLRISAYRSHPISNNKKAPAPDGTNAFLVPLTGIEPVRVLPHGILSPGRLPVPPQRQMNLLYKSTLYPYLCKLSSIFIKISGLSFSNMLSTASLCSRITWRVL